MGSDFYEAGVRGGQHWLVHSFSSPPALPIFKEVDPLAHRLSFTIAYPSNLRSGEVFYLTTSVQTPGYSATERWAIFSRAGTLRMCPPGHPSNPERSEAV
jgi:hypothetical protein